MQTLHLLPLVFFSAATHSLPVERLEGTSKSWETYGLIAFTANPSKNGSLLHFSFIDSNFNFNKLSATCDLQLKIGGDKKKNSSDYGWFKCVGGDYRNGTSFRSIGENTTVAKTNIECNRLCLVEGTFPLGSTSCDRLNSNGDSLLVGEWCQAKRILIILQDSMPRDGNNPRLSSASSLPQSSPSPTKDTNAGQPSFSLKPESAVKLALIIIIASFFAWSLAHMLLRKEKVYH